MAKVTRVTIANLDNPSTAVSQINTNFANIQTAMDNTLSRDGTSPNTMLASLDMNSNRIINLPAPENDAEPVRLADLPALVEEAETAIEELIDQAEIDLQAALDAAQVEMDADLAAAQAAQVAAELAETNAESAASNAATSEANAATSESNASTSETNAAAHEANAETAEINAEAAEAGAEAALAAAEALVAAFPTITSTDAGAAGAPDLVLDRNSASPAGSDVLGRVLFRGRDNAGNAVTYGKIQGFIADAVDGSEDGHIDLVTIRNNVDDQSRLTLESTGTVVVFSHDSGASAGPILRLDRSSTSPAASDVLGQILFRGRDSGGNSTDYAATYATISDTTDGSEDGVYRISTMIAGTLTNTHVFFGPTMRTDAAAGIVKEVSFSTAGLNRWSIRSNSSPESGADAGSNFQILSYNDAGSLKDTNFQIIRSSGEVTITKTDDTSAGGPNLILDRISASPALNDIIGSIYFRGRDSAANLTSYASILPQIVDATDGSEDGALALQVVVNGTLATIFQAREFGLNLNSGAIRFPSTQIPSTGANDLDDYEEGSVSVALAFGGASTGITYTSQSLHYTKIGQLVTCKVNLNLSNKGSSTGSATITGLPFTVENNGTRHGGCSSFQSNMTSVTGPIQLLTVANGTTAELYQVSAGNSVALTDANFANNSVIQISFSYEVA